MRDELNKRICLVFYTAVVAACPCLVLVLNGPSGFSLPKMRRLFKPASHQELPDELTPHDESGNTYRMIRVGDQYVYVP